MKQNQTQTPVQETPLTEATPIETETEHAQGEPIEQGSDPADETPVVGE